MQRTFKTRLKVNDVESNILAQWCGVSRLAYNVCLDQWNRDYENGVKHNYYSIKKWVNPPDLTVGASVLSAEMIASGTAT